MFLQKSVAIGTNKVKFDMKLIRILMRFAVIIKNCCMQFCSLTTYQFVTFI